MIVSAIIKMIALTAPVGEMEISAMAGQSPITIRTCAHDAGAICSLTWNGKEFVNDYDHGRQCQSASSFDYQGEYFNPTEAGASSTTDGWNPHPSSSKLLYQLASANALTTQTQMAYWIPFGGEALSHHILTKRVKIGLPGLQHAIEYLTEFEVPPTESHGFATFEALTCYMRPEFERFYGYDAQAVKLLPVDDGPGEQTKPLIFTTSDGAYAMGVYSPDLPQPSYPQAGYGRWRHFGTTKWNVVYRVPSPAGTYKFRMYIAVGSADDVMRTIAQLARQH